MTLTRPFEIPVQLPRGPEHYWKVMCAAGSAGFTVGDVAGCTNGVAWSTVKDYITRLAKEGLVKVIGGKPSAGGVKIHVYAVTKISTMAPVLRRPDYTGVRGRSQAQVWTAMRSLGAFTLRELAVAASTDDHVVKPRTAEAYVRMLMKAGIVVAVEPYAKGRKGRPFGAGAAPGTYRLTRAGNTGPAAPKVFKASIVFDPNKNRVVKVAETEEVLS